MLNDNQQTKTQTRIHTTLHIGVQTDGHDTLCVLVYFRDFVIGLPVCLLRTLATMCRKAL